MKPRILVTLGPSPLSQKIIERCSDEKIYLFRINLSHTPFEELEETIAYIQRYTDVPICIDTEGAQIRNQKMINGNVYFTKNDTVKIHYDEVIGDNNNISFTPKKIARDFLLGDRLYIDFDSVCLKIVDKNKNYCLSEVETEGVVGSNKAVNLNRDIKLEAITQKDCRSISIGKKWGIKYFALSFSMCQEDVMKMRQLTGYEACIISKIESPEGVLNLNGILKGADQILIDRGDLSRKVPLSKIPFLQRRIVSHVRAMGKPVYVATNLLESMVTTRTPTRSELNDVISTLLMGASGLVLASETAIGKYPLEAVKMIRDLIEQYEKWTPNTSLGEILQY